MEYHWLFTIIELIDSQTFIMKVSGNKTESDEKPDVQCFEVCTANLKGMSLSI